MGTANAYAFSIYSRLPPSHPPLCLTSHTWMEWAVCGRRHDLGAYRGSPGMKRILRGFCHVLRDYIGIPSWYYGTDGVMSAEKRKGK